MSDDRPTNDSRPRISSSDPTTVIDKPDSHTITNFPHDRPKYYITFGFEEYRRPSQFENLKSKGINDYICLPLPNNLVDHNTLGWNTNDGNFIVEALTPAFRNTSDALKTGGVGGLMDSGKKIIGQSSDALTGAVVKGVTQAGMNILDTFAGDNAGTSLLQAAGLADNPFSTVAFTGPDFKAHNFNWRLAPKSPEESKTIKDIIRIFKKAAYPELLSSDNGGFFKYPNIVWPKFQPEGVIDGLYRFKPCVITAIEANFSPNDRPGFFSESMAPVEIVVSVSLKEIELWKNGDDSNDPRVIKNGDFSKVDLGEI